MRTNQGQRGFSLMELMISVCLISLAAPFLSSNLKSAIHTSKVQAQRNLTYQSIRSLREFALVENTYATLCYLDDDAKCDGISDKLTGFQDKNNNKKLDSDEAIYLQLDLSDSKTTWRKDKRPIRFGSAGRALGYNGTLTACYPSDTGFTLVISKAGRIRVNPDIHACQFEAEL